MQKEEVISENYLQEDSNFGFAKNKPAKQKAGQQEKKGPKKAAVVETKNETVKAKAQKVIKEEEVKVDES